MVEPASRKLCGMIQAAIKDEADGIAQYRKILRQVEKEGFPIHSDIRHFLEVQAIRDESFHWNTLRTLRDKYCIVRKKL